MTCMPLTQSRHRNPIVPALVCALIVMAAVAYASHAVERHGADAEQIRKCLENNTPSMRLANPLTGRIARICWTNEKYGIQITDKTETQEVTSFYDKGSKTLEQVVRYLFNAGYTGVP
jgi:hypothetical protein